MKMIRKSIKRFWLGTFIVIKSYGTVHNLLYYYRWIIHKNTFYFRSWYIYRYALSRFRKWCYLYRDRQYSSFIMIHHHLKLNNFIWSRWNDYKLRSHNKHMFSVMIFYNNIILCADDWRDWFTFVWFCLYTFILYYKEFILCLYL